MTVTYAGLEKNISFKNLKESRFVFASKKTEI